MKQPREQGIDTPLHYSDERGFVLVWTSFIILPLMFVGFVFFGYSRANLLKLEANYRAMNLVVMGTRSSEFDGAETINSMAALASSMGFSQIEPDQSYQFTSGGEIALRHDTSTSDHRVSAIVGLELDPVSSLVANLGGVDVHGYSRAKPGYLLMSLVLDYSQSLNRDFNPNDLLEAFGVRTANGGVGANGVLHGSNPVPNDVTTLALPFGWMQEYRVRMPWQHQGANWPYEFITVPNCTITNENGCSGSRGAHRDDLAYNMSNNFMQYKRAATILAGVAAQTTPHLTVELLGGMLPDGSENFFNLLMVGGDNPYSPLVNDGSFKVWSYDDPSVQGYDINPLFTNGGTEPFFTVNVAESHSFSNPKDVFEDNVIIDGSTPTSLFLHLTGYRKLLRYGTFTSGNQGTSANPAGPYVHAPGTFSAAVEPPLPVLQNPKFNPPPVDSFVWQKYPLDLPYYSMALDIGGPFGFPTIPGMLTTEGPAYPEQSMLYTPIANGVVYGCQAADPVLNPYGTVVGPSASNNAPLSQDKNDTGYLLCLIRDICDNNMKDNSVRCSSGAGAIPPNEINVYYDENPANRSPRCAAAGQVPRCKGTTFRPVEESAVFCGFGDSGTNTVPRCPLGGVPECYDGTLPIAERFTGALPLCNNFAGLPPGHGNCHATHMDGAACRSAIDPTNPITNGAGVPAYSLGTVSLPNGAAPTVKSNFFFYLNDHSPFPMPGTNTQASIPVDYCTKFQNESDGLGRCAYVLITDGRPQSINPDGSVRIDDATLLESITQQMDEFTENLGGKSFVWFLGQMDQWTGIENQIEPLVQSNSLNANQVAAYNQVQSGNPICGTSHVSHWNSIPVNKPGCPVGGYATIDDIRQIHSSEQAMLDDFKAIMDDTAAGGDRSRFWIETEVENTASGGSISGSSLTTFLGGLKNLLALLKREPEFDM